MPSRVVRGEINASESLSGVSLEADLTFRALIVAVDDYGRLDARPAFLKATLFPMRERVKASQIMRWIRELDAEGCIRLYEVDDKPYLHLTGWETHRGSGRRAGSSKYPEYQPSEKSPEIREMPGNPSGNRESGDEKRGTRDEGRDRRRASPGAVCPDPLPSEDAERLVRLAASDGFDRDQCRYAAATVRNWSLSNGKRKRDWPRTILNAMRSGWGLEGYGGTDGKRDRSQTFGERDAERVRQITARVVARYEPGEPAGPGAGGGEAVRGPEPGGGE